jgi:hypothetical protein
MYYKLICILYALLCGQNFILLKSGCYIDPHLLFVFADHVCWLELILFMYTYIVVGIHCMGLRDVVSRFS